MQERKQSNAPTARALALLVLLALIAVAVVPASPTVYAGGSGGNDTVTSTAVGDSGVVETITFEPVSNSELDLPMLWNLLLVMLR